MILLPNDCRCSGTTGDPTKGIPDELSVFPKNWKAKNASVNKSWYIHFRFYDPLFRDRHPKGFQVRLKDGLNHFRTTAERQGAVRAMMDEMLDLLKNQCYNPITETLTDPPADDSDYIIHPNTGLSKALDAALSRLARAKSTLSDISNTLRAVNKAAAQLRKTDMPISSVTRRHIKALFEQMAKNSDQWSVARYNKHRANLRMVFSELIEVEAIETNPMSDLKKQKGQIKTPRATLTDDQRIAIDQFLRENYYTFWLFTNIFFHSGCRETEMMKVQGKDVDLEKQVFYVIVLKGEVYSREARVIKDAAVDFWRQALAKCKDSDYVFSRGLKPGPKPISPRQITQRWRKHVKGMKKTRGKGVRPDRMPTLDIPVDADFYSLKHTNFDETTILTDISTAASHAGHRSTKMGEQVYAVGEKQRKMERQRQVNNSFAPSKPAY